MAKYITTKLTKTVNVCNGIITANEYDDNGVKRKTEKPFIVIEDCDKHAEALRRDGLKNFMLEETSEIVEKTLVIDFIDIQRLINLGIAKLVDKKPNTEEESTDTEEVNG